MGLFDWFRSRKTVEEKVLEKQDRAMTLSGVKRMLAIAEKLEASQAVISAEVEKIKTQQAELQKIFASKDMVIKSSFFLYPRKKRGQIRLTVSPLEWADKLYEIFKGRSQDGNAKK